MMITSDTVLSRQLRPLCPRDDHAMEYELGSSGSNSGQRASYHCGLVGCSVRYNAITGYFMLMGMPNTYSVDEPGVNVVRCPVHDCWLYRRENIAVAQCVRWCCSVEGCTYVYSAGSEDH
jgi:hypothetical protein